METITYYDGRRVLYEDYGMFSDARDVLRNCGTGYVSYYDDDGEAHICEFALVRGGIMCMGETILVTDGKDMYDCTGMHLDSRLYELAGKAVKFGREDFCGWLI